MNMLSTEYTTLSKGEILERFKSNSRYGLTKGEVKKRLKEFGKNEIPDHRSTWLKILFRQLKSPFIYLLFGAAVLSFLVGEMLDTFLIFIFILINTVLGFYQEFRSEETFKALRERIISYSSVLRDGKVEQIDTRQLVPGDIVIVQTGDRIPADMRVLETRNLSVDESVLTGESVPVTKHDKDTRDFSENTITFQNMIYSGSVVVDGTARCIVITTGTDTSFGRIAELTLETQTVSGLENALSRFSKAILKIVSITLALMIILNLVLGLGVDDFPTLLIFTVALAISVIPQALPLVMTFSLSLGASDLAKKGVAVRRLSAIEDLGSLNILCTDKTGTITENKLEVKSLYPGSNPDLLLYANLAASIEEGRGLEPFDIALWEALSEENRNEISKFARIEYIPFNPSLRRNGVLVDTDMGGIAVFRGAVETILSGCALPRETERKIIDWVGEKEGKGMRCLAIAKRDLDDIKGVKSNKVWDYGGLEFVGVVSFEDPIKATVLTAISKATEAGIGIKLITGDSRRVAISVSREIGLIESAEEVITGSEFEKLSEEEKISAVMENKVFARFTPEQKHETVRLLKQRYRVGFLGDGINDAPALKMSDVSIVVPNSTDIAREASDIVLLERDLEVIVEGIREGRKVFANTIKYLILTLSANFGNFYALALASLFISFPPMLPIQILLLNLLSDFPMIAVATDSVDENTVSKPRRYNVGSILLFSTVLGLLSTVFDFGFFFYFLGTSPAILQTSWFIGSVLTELVFIFSIRTEKIFFRSSPPSKWLTFMALAAGSITIALPFIGFGQKYFQFEAIGYNNLLIILLIVVAYFISTELVKLLCYRKSGLT